MIDQPPHNLSTIPPHRHQLTADAPSQASAVCELTSGPGQRLYLSVVGGVDVLRVVTAPDISYHTTHKGGEGAMSGLTEGRTGSVTIQRLMFVSVPTSLLSDMCLLPSSSSFLSPSLPTLPLSRPPTDYNDRSNVCIAGIDR